MIRIRSGEGIKSEEVRAKGSWGDRPNKRFEISNLFNPVSAY